MALKVGELFAELNLNDSNFNAGMDKAKQSFSGLGGRLASMAQVGAIATGAALATGAVMGTEAFASFQNGMNEVFTLLPDITEKSMSEMSKQVKNLSDDMGILPEDAVPALYQAISAGVPQDNVFEFLKTANKAAVGGVAGLETVVDGITSVINAYGTDVLSAAQASDLMFTAVKLGKTNFEQLSASLFQVIPTASAIGVEFGTVTAALAAMTAQGTPTSVATTQLRQMLVELSKEGGKTSKTFREISGKTFKEFIAAGGDTQQALQLLEKHAAKTGIGVNDLFGSVEAGNAALALTGKGTERFTDNLTAMDESAGATDAAYARMEKGMSRSFKKIWASIKVVLIEIGEKLQPVVEQLANHIQENMPAIRKAVVGTFEKITTAIGWVTKNIIPPLITAFKFIQENFDIIAPALAGMITMVIVPAFIAWAIAAKATALATIIALAPVMLPILAVGVAIAALAYIWKRWGDDIIAFTKMSIDWTVNKFVEFRTKAVEIFNATRDKILSIWDGITTGIKDSINYIIKAINAFIGGMNKISFNVPDWVPGIGGNSFGISIPKIPILGAGDVVKSPTMEALAQNNSSTTVGGMQSLQNNTTAKHQHSGTIRVEGVNNTGELIGAADIFMGTLRREVRR